MVDPKHPHLQNLPRNSHTRFLSEGPLGNNNSVEISCLQTGWILRWGSSGVAVPSVSAPFFCPCLSFRQEHFWVKNIEMAGWPHPLTGDLFSLLEMVSTSSISPMLHILANIIPVGSWEPLFSLASGTLQRLSPVPYPPLLHIFIQFLDLLYLSPIHFST